MGKNVKVGRPRKYNEVETWGTKLSGESKQKIKLLAEIRKKPAGEAIMELVDKALAGMDIEPVKKSKITVRELRQMPTEEQSRIVEAQAKIGAKDFEFENDFDDFYNED